MINAIIGVVQQNVPKRRAAVTLVEVIFAMGVVLIGLLGLLSILPLAGQRAQESISLSVGNNVGQQAFDELLLQNYLSSGRLKPIRRHLGIGLDEPVVANLGIPSSSFCFDPMFASSTTIVAETAIPANGYNQTRFPYYDDNHNPFLDPSTNSTSWPVSQPRVTRVGVTGRVDSPATAIDETNVFISRISAFNLVESGDSLNVTRPKDRSLNANFSNANLNAVSGGLEYGKRLSRGDFTWFATVDPLPDGRYASVSIVVQKNRERLFDLPTATTAPSSVEENGVSERVAYVSFASGFSGGAGGVVHLVSNANTSDRLLANDWVMLSRNTPSGPVHRWFRIASVSRESEKLRITSSDLTTDNPVLGCRVPAGTFDVWRHKVYLDGSDWAFGFAESGNDRKFADSSLNNNTYAAIVSDVVSVTQRVVLQTEL
jgi:type II secretory pathway pseudopilin PulG